MPQRGDLVYYEGEPSGDALVVEDKGDTADILLFPEEGGGGHQYKTDVPWRAEGGGHTIRREK